VGSFGICSGATRSFPILQIEYGEDLTLWLVITAGSCYQPAVMVGDLVTVGSCYQPAVMMDITAGPNGHYGHQL